MCLIREAPNKELHGGHLYVYALVYYVDYIGQGYMVEALGCCDYMYRDSPYEEKY